MSDEANVDDAPKKKGRPRGGFKKTKRQISVRLDKATMDLVVAHIKDSQYPTRKTDLMERGLVLAMREHMEFVPLPMQARFMVADASEEELQLVLNLFVLQEMLRKDMVPSPKKEWCKFVVEHICDIEKLLTEEEMLKAWHDWLKERTK